MTEAEWVAAYRSAYPRSRVKSILKYYRNGGNGPRQKVCIVCGKLGPSWCGRWPMTKRAERWHAEHIASHTEGNNVPPFHGC